MLTQLGLQNFKSFEELQPQGLRGLTLLCGKNSCGKSSFLQSLLLLKQSSKQMDRYALTLNGGLVRLGDYSQAVSAQRVSDRVGYTLVVDGYGEVELEYVYEGDSIRLYKLAGRPENRSEYVNIRTVSHGENVYFRPNVGALAEDDDEVSTLRLDYDAIRPRHTLGGLMEPPQGVELLQGEERALPRARELIIELRDALERVEDWLAEHVRYLGPVRHAPERYYVIEGRPELGPHGENSVAVLAQKHDQDVRMIAPGGVRRSTRTLEDWVAEWLDYFDFNYSFTADSSDNILYQLQLSLPNFSEKIVSPRDVGYGLSQVLPILVGGLLAGEDDLLILEQPEIHLHPAVQSKLGDFLLNLARAGRHILVETHSEYLVNRLRLRVAQDDDGQMQQKVRVLFVEQDDTWRSEVRPLDFDRFGGLEDWPAGFFDSQQDDLRALSQAALQKLQED